MSLPSSARSMSLAAQYAAAEELEGAARATALANLASVEETLALTAARDRAQAATYAR